MQNQTNQNDRAVSIIDRHELKIMAASQEVVRTRLTDTVALKIACDKFDELRKQKTEYEKRCEFLRNDIGSPNQQAKFDLESKRLESCLPIYAQKSAIKKSIIDNRVSIIVADTGSGKSTQIPQYLIEIIDEEKKKPKNNFGRRVVCTQPRKVAAISLAKRVAEELGVNLGGQEVGYNVGGSSAYSVDTCVVFTTDTFLLQECLHDPILLKYNVVIVDEAHERNLNTDLALAMLKRCLLKRVDTFRIIITSATIDSRLFSDYFGGAISSVLTVPGRLHPVDIKWAEIDTDLIKKTQQIVPSVVAEVEKICSQNRSDLTGGILAFLTTPAETELASRSMSSRQDLWILQMHGRLQPEEQQEIFKPCPQGKRKVVFATNSAETSVTISGIRFVVDCGLVKERRFDAARNSSSLAVGWTSKSSAIQRAGRAGRTGPGVCHRLYSRTQFNNQMPDRFVAEIKRSNMAQTLLYLYAFKIDRPMEFDLIEKPTKKAMQGAQQRLIRLGALSEDGNTLTEVGEKMSKLSQVEPRLSRLLIMAAQENQNNFIVEATAMVACISVGNLFFLAGTDDQKNSSDLHKMQFCESSGDPVSYLRVYDEWLKSDLPSKQIGMWCKEKYINGKSMKAVGDLFSELRHSLVQIAKLPATIDFQKSFNIDSALLTLTKLFLRCFNENLAMYTGHSRIGYYVPALNDFIAIHPSSAVFASGADVPPKWMVFEYVFATSRQFAFDVAVVDEVLLKPENGVDQSILQKCEKHSLAKRHLDEFGHTAKRFISDNKTALEEHAKMAYDGALCFIECPFKEQWNRMWLYAPERCLNRMLQEIQERVKKIGDELIGDFKELPIRFQKTTTRVCIKAGGVVDDVLMRDEFRSVTIGTVPIDKSTVDDVLKIVGSSGVVKVRRNKKFDSHVCTIDKWGQIGYNSKQIAKRVVESTKRYSEYIAKPIFGYRPPPTSALTSCRVLISWCRRPPKDTAGKQSAIVKLRNPADQARVLKIFRDAAFSATPERGQNDGVFLPAIPPMPSDRALEEFCRILLASSRVEITRANLMREKGFQMTPGEGETFKNILNQHIISTTGMATAEFQVAITTPHASAKEYEAVLTIRDATRTDELIKLLSKKLLNINSQLVKFATSAYFEVVVIPDQIYGVTKDAFDQLSTNVLISIPATELKIKSMKNGKIAAKIISSDYQFAIRVRGLVQEILRGFTIDCTQSPALLRPSAAEYMEELKAKHCVLIDVDRPKQKIVIHGSSDNINKAKLDLNEYLSEMALGGGLVSRRIYLKPPAYPSSILKSLMATCDYNTDGLVALLPDCLSLKIDCARRRLDYNGLEESFHQLETILTELASKLPAANEKVDDDIPECPACFCPTEGGQTYCVESCGHHYCNECILGQLRTSIGNRQFPIVCVKENCGKPFVIKDFETVLSLANKTEPNDDANTGDSNKWQEEQAKWESLMDASLAAYLVDKKNVFGCCMTPDCRGIYRKTQTIGQYCCDMCQVRMCTQCGADFHPGQTCDSYRRMKMDPDASINEWIREDPKNRKRCPSPNCRMPAELKDGCNHVTCRCGTHFCWVCLAAFRSGEETYAHLGSQHGGYWNFNRPHN